MQDITQYPFLITYSSKSRKLKIITKKEGFSKKQYPLLSSFVSELNKLSCSSLFCLSIKTKKKINQAKLNRVIEKYRKKLSYYYSWVNKCPTSKVIYFADISFSFIELGKIHVRNNRQPNSNKENNSSNASITPSSKYRDFAFDTHMAKTLITKG